MAKFKMEKGQRKEGQRGMNGYMEYWYFDTYFISGNVGRERIYIHIDNQALAKRALKALNKEFANEKLIGYMHGTYFYVPVISKGNTCLCAYWHIVTKEPYHSVYGLSTIKSGLLTRSNTATYKPMRITDGESRTYWQQKMCHFYEGCLVSDANKPVIVHYRCLLLGPLETGE